MKKWVTGMRLLQGSYTFSISKFHTFPDSNLQTIFMVHRALFSAFYLVYSTVTCRYFYFIDFLEVTTYRVPKIKKYNK